MPANATLGTLLGAAIFLSACASTDQTVEPPPGYGRGSPRQTIWYLQWSVEQRSARHVWNCLSENLKRRENLSLSDVDLFFSRFEEEVTRYVGKIEDVEVDDIEAESATSRLVHLIGGDRRATVRFVLETTWELNPSRPGVDSISGLAHRVEDVLEFRDGQARIVLPGVGNKFTPADIERVSIDNAWRIDSIVSHDLDDLERALRDARQESDT